MSLSMAVLKAREGKRLSDLTDAEKAEFQTKVQDAVNRIVGPSNGVATLMDQVAAATAVTSRIAEITEASRRVAALNDLLRPSVIQSATFLNWAEDHSRIQKGLAQIAQTNRIAEMVNAALPTRSVLADWNATLGSFSSYNSDYDVLGLWRERNARIFEEVLGKVDEPTDETVPYADTSVPRIGFRKEWNRRSGE